MEVLALASKGRVGLRARRIQRQTKGATVAKSGGTCRGTGCVQRAGSGASRGTRPKKWQHAKACHLGPGE